MDEPPWSYGLWSVDKTPWFYGLWSMDETPWFYGDKKGLTLQESILSVADPGLEPESPP